MTLEEARIEINAVDAEMAVLFERRMKAVESVIEYKLEHGLPIYDAAREAQVIENNCKRVKNPDIMAYYREFLVSLMDLSKQYQQVICDKNQK